MQDIINNVKSKCTGVELDSESIEETVVYFDYGVGSINLLIKGKLEKKEAITCLGDLALSIQENIQKRAKKGLCGLCVFDNWKDFRDSMGEAFKGFKYDKWRISLLKDKDEERGRTNFVGTGALLYIDETRNLGKYERSELEPKLSRFAGLKPEVWRDFKDIKYLAEGYDGHIALLSDGRQETWLMNLWQFITDHYSAVRDLGNCLYAWTAFLGAKSGTDDQKYISEVLQDLRNIESSTDTLTHESLPYNFAGTDDEKVVYEGIYKSWDTEKAVNSLHENFKTLSARVNNEHILLVDKARRKSKRAQERLNYLVAILGLITIISVSHDIFQFKLRDADVLCIFLNARKLYTLSLFIFLMIGTITLFFS